ncbi:hypothetical protein [Bacillus sp. AK031]
MGNNQTNPCERCSEDSLLCLSIPGGLCLQILGLQLTLNDLLLELGPETDLAGISDLLNQLLGSGAVAITAQEETSEN